MSAPFTWGSDGTGMHGTTTSQWRECDALGNVLLGNVNLDVNFDILFLPLNEEEKSISGFLFSVLTLLYSLWSVEDPTVD